MRSKATYCNRFSPKKELAGTPLKAWRFMRRRHSQRHQRRSPQPPAHVRLLPQTFIVKRFFHMEPLANGRRHTCA